MQDKTLRNTLLGKHDNLSTALARSIDWQIPARNGREDSITIRYAGDDGLINEIIQRVILLEKEVEKLKFKKKK